MKNKKGFTLIELLAVIIILAIIALVAIPIILNMIDKAKRQAAIDSAYGFIDAVEYNNGFASLEKEGYTEITGEDIDITTLTNLKMKGKRPTDGKIDVNQNGKVYQAVLCFNNYRVIYDGISKSTIVRKGCSEQQINEEVPTNAATIEYINSNNPNVHTVNDALEDLENKFN